MRLAVDDDGGVAVVDGVGDGGFGIELLALLVEIGDLQPRPAADGALVGLELADQQPQQRRLSGPVRTDQPDAIAAQDPSASSRARRHGRRRLVVTLLGLEHKTSGRLAKSSTASRTAPAPARRAARSSRSASSARTRPSLRVRRALTPWRSHASSCASFRSSRSRSRASASSAAAFFSRYVAIGPRPGGERAAIQLDDPRGQRGEERAIVRHEQHRARNTRAGTARASAMASMSRWFVGSSSSSTSGWDTSALREERRAGAIRRTGR